MKVIISGIAVIAMLIGAIFYNPLRRKWAKVVGVGGSYMILLGIMILVMGISTLVSVISGEGNSASAGETVTMVVVGVLCLLYMGYVMLLRCETAGQRIMLPFAACLIGLGFCWRFLFALILHIPMESGEAASVAFPTVLISPEGEEFRMQSDSGDHADYYCMRTGQTVQFWQADIEDGLPNGWRRGA